MTPKEQAIKKAYGEYYDAYRKYIDPDGWVSWVRAAPLPNMEETDTHESGLYWRPASLNGIEDNRGWIPVEERLPENYYDRCWIHTNEGNTEIGLWSGTTQCWDDEEGFYLRKLTEVTHWQPVVQPEPPLF